VYSFQFGGTGTSNTLATEGIGTTDGTSTTFQKVLDNSPVVANSVSVTDGTYTWSQSAGSSNEDQFGVAYSTSLRRVTANYYNGAPAAGRTITATYRYGTSGITGALSNGAEHWMSISVDGTTQGARQRVLAVPFSAFSTKAAFADSIDESSLMVPTLMLSRLIDEVALSGTNSSFYRIEDFPSGPSGRNGTVETSSLEMTWDAPTNSMTTRALTRSGSINGAWFDQTWDLNGPIDSISLNAAFNNSRVTARMQFIYADGTRSSEIQIASANNQIVSNPVLSKLVQKIRVWSWLNFGYSPGGDSFTCSHIPNYQSGTPRSIVIQVSNVPQSTFGLRTIINGSASAGKLLSNCISWRVIYLDGSESQPALIGREILWSNGKIPKSIKVSTVPAQLGADTIDLSRIVVRLISKS
jgi:hypothetical protein